MSLLGEPVPLLDSRCLLVCQVVAAGQWKAFRLITRTRVIFRITRASSVRSPEDGGWSGSPSPVPLLISTERPRSAGPTCEGDDRDGDSEAPAPLHINAEAARAAVVALRSSHDDDGESAPVPVHVVPPLITDSSDATSHCTTPNNRGLVGRRRPSVTWVGDDDPGLALPLISDTDLTGGTDQPVPEPVLPATAPAAVPVAAPLTLGLEAPLTLGLEERTTVREVVMFVGVTCVTVELLAAMPVVRVQDRRGVCTHAGSTDGSNLLWKPTGTFLSFSPSLPLLTSHHVHCSSQSKLSSVSPSLS